MTKIEEPQAVKVEAPPIYAVGEYVLVWVPPPPEETAAGLHLPGETKEFMREAGGLIVSVGDAVTNDDERVALGDYVYYNKFAASKLPWNGEDYHIIHKDDVLARLGESVVRYELVLSGAANLRIAQTDLPVPSDDQSSTAEDSQEGS